MRNNKLPQIIALPDLGKVPPQATDIESVVLGICMVYPDSFYDIRLKPEMFYKDAHQKIFQVITDLAISNSISLYTVTNRLRDLSLLDTVGGPLYLTNLTLNVFSDSLVSQYALIVKEKYLRREYIRISVELQTRAFDDSFDLSELIEFSESELFKLSDFTQAKEPKAIDKCVDELIINIEKIQSKEKSLIGIPSGYTSIDRITGGWQPGNLIIIAGRPSMGKTALALNLALNTTRLNYPVCFFSLEMSEIEITSRLMSSVSGYTNVEIRNARVDMPIFSSKANDIAVLPFYIDDTPAITIFELRSKVKKMILRSGVKMIIVDYLQLMSAEAGSREQEVSTISRGLKAISKEFDIPVIALSQLNRGVEDRADKRPRLSDLRESGAIEQDADIVSFIYRPAYYNIKLMDIDGNNYDTEGLIVIDCAKNRSGAIFTKPFKHNLSLTVIEEKELETTSF